MRQRDLMTWVGRRLDWLLTSEERVVTCITVAVGCGVVILARDGGLVNVVENAESLGVIGGGLYGAAWVLRRTRGVQVIARKRPRTEKNLPSQDAED